MRIMQGIIEEAFSIHRAVLPVRADDITRWILNECQTWARYIFSLTVGSDDPSQRRVYIYKEV